jgi:hypothetical protein
MIDFRAPLAGLERSAAEVDRIASHLDPGNPDQAVGLLQARREFQTNVKVIHVEDQISQSLLDLLG